MKERSKKSEKDKTRFEVKTGKYSDCNKKKHDIQTKKIFFQNKM